MRTTSRSERTTSLRNTNLYLSILQSIRDSNKLPDDVFRENGILRSNRRQWYVNYLKDIHCIKKGGYGTWEITKKGLKFFKELQVETQRVKKPLKLDFIMRMSIPVLKELEKKFDSDLEKKVKGWVKKYRWFNVPFYNYELTFEKTPKSLIISVHHMEISEPKDLEIIANHIKEFVPEYFASRRIMLLDKINTRVSYIKYGIMDEKVKQLLPEGHYPTFYLGRKREKIFPSDTNQEAEVHLDKTPFDWTIHSNDKTYVERYIKMPEIINALDRKLVPSINRLSEEMALHSSVLTEMKDTLRVMKRELSNEDGWKVWKRMMK